MNAVDRARALMIAVQFMSGKEAVLRVAADAIRAAEADARREALEEAAKLADETELIPLQGVLAKSKPDADYAYWVAEGFRILARRIRALASQKGEP